MLSFQRIIKISQLRQSLILRIDYLINLMMKIRTKAHLDSILNKLKQNKNLI